MKKMTLAFSLAALLATSFVGCGSSAPTPSENPTKQAAQVNNEFEGAPAWVLMPDTEGGLSASGSAKMGAAGLDFARTEAAANARDELARQLGVKVNNLVTNFTQTTGVGDAQTVDKVTKSVSKQVASVDLTGSKVAKVWMSKSNNLYVLVTVDPTTLGEIKQKMKDAALSSFQDDKALYQQFLAKKGGDELDSAVEKEFGAK